MIAIINKVLLVEDDAFKENQIIKHLKMRNNKIQIVKKTSLNSAMREISANHFEIVFLDMSLPTFDNNESEHFKPYGGMLILDELKRKHSSIPVVIITQYTKFGEGSYEKTLDEISEQCKEKYPNFKEIIYFVSDTWKEKIDKYITGE